jgi:S-DNA-T family DNA segregation ATPase FtsK/SpoIIIE
MGRKRIHPKNKQKGPKWYQKENEWGDYVFDWSLGLSGESWRTIISIIIFILAVTMFLGFLGKAGALGEMLSSAGKKGFGTVGSYIFDLAFVYFAFILMIPPKKGYRIAEFIGILLLTISVPVFMHLFVPVEAAKSAAALGQNGGNLGYALSVPLRNAIGLFPTFLLAVAMIAISLLMIFDFSLIQFLGIKQKDDEDEDKVNVVHGGESAPARVSVFDSVKKKFGFGRGKLGESKAQVIEVAPGLPAQREVAATKKDVVWQYPPVEILKESNEVANPGNIYKNAELIQKCLKTFNVDVALGDANVGPTVTQYTLKPNDGVKLNTIVARQNDLALALSAKSIRIEAPIPGKNAVGVEIPNKVGAKVTLKEIMLSGQMKGLKSKLAIALGRDVAGEPVAIDLEKMPHLLIAGSTGSGKSVCINAIITNYLFNNSPADMRLLLVDPKRVELTCYNDIPHLLAPVVTEVDKTVSALKWAVYEMERRYQMFSQLGKRNITAYNADPGPEGRLPYIVIIIDELADLMATSSKEVEGSIVRLAQMARATGMHLIIATQRPSVDVLTGLIKANIASRIAFATASQVDSRTILDMSGAEKLLGFGDMLFMAAGIKPRRVQGCFVSDGEIEQLVKFIRDNSEPQYDQSILSFGAGRAGGGGSMGGGGDEDDLYAEAAETVINAGKASASLLQRRLKVGYARAARLLDILEENGVIGPADGAKPRDVLVSDLQFKSAFSSHANNVADSLHQTAAYTPPAPTAPVYREPEYTSLSTTTDDFPEEEDSQENNDGIR